MPRPVHKTNLTNAPASTRLYQGYNPQGQIGFDRTWELKDGTGYHPLGERATLALGLTERCAAMGRGMVSASFYHLVFLALTKLPRSIMSPTTQTMALADLIRDHGLSFLLFYMCTICGTMRAVRRGMICSHGSASIAYQLAATLFTGERLSCLYL
jgi:hypothetical protein